MKDSQKSYREVSNEVKRDLRKIIKKHEMDMDQAIDHFSMFLASMVIEESTDRTLDSMNFVHSFARYVMALQIDEKSGIKDQF